MKPRRQFDTGVDTSRNDAALKRAEPGRPGRLPPRTARSLAAVLLVAFAAILVPLQAQAQTGICGRTEQVRDGIVALISGVSDCALVTDAHLAAITGTLSLNTKGITALAAGDFDGLTALTELYLPGNSLDTLSADVFDELTSLEYLQLDGNSLTTLPAGVFDELTTLLHLQLIGNSLTTLPAGVFDELTSLLGLYLSNNYLDTLPAGVFDGLTALTDLLLQTNSLSTLPDDVFEELTALRYLGLHGNPGAPFSPTAVALPDDGTVPVAGGTVTLDGSGSEGGPWGANVTYSWALTSPTSGVTVTFDDAASAKPEVTIPALTAGAELTFTLTVTGRATFTPNGASPDTDAATVTAPAANAAPSFTSSATFNAAENQTAVGTVAASDSDTGDSVTGYAIHGGADASKFSLVIVASTGVLTFASAPNFEAPADADTGNDYVVVVRAMSGAGVREKTADQTITVTVTDVGGEAPGVPVAPFVSSASLTSVTVAWIAPANAGPAITDYDYRHRVTSPQGSWTEVTTTTITALSATITGLTEGTEYDVQVRATNDEGTSGWSDPGTGTPTGATEAGAISNAPENLQATAGDAEATLRWDAPLNDSGADITGYAYRYKESGGDFIAYTDIPESGPGEANARSYTVTELTNGLEYVFHVRALNEHGGGLPAEVTVTLPGIVSSESEELPAEVTLSANYPNPFNPETTIRYALPQAGQVRLVVYDLLGHEVEILVDQSKPAGDHTVRFGAGNLASGLYVYRLQAQGKTIVRTMILVK